MRPSSVLRASFTSLLVFNFSPADAACTLTPTSGDDTYVCDSGSQASLTDLLGNNSLTLPTGGTGNITGAVTFGPGTDRLLVQSGVIGGAVAQGSGIDDFVMSGGQVQSLAQGDGLDTFTMIGGTIVGAFEDGDIARMTGGSIGRVDMKLDDNLFDMSGGRINGNLVAGFGRDTMLISGGSIGGNISISGGNDVVRVTGGDVGGQVLMSFGDDSFTWSSGGLIHGAVQLADGNDTAVLSALNQTLLGATPLINGGPGNDSLTFDATSASGGARYSNWETVSLANSSTLDLPDTFILGDSVSGTGSLAIDSSSVLGASQGTVAPFASGQNATLSNAGLIDMTRSGELTTDRLYLVGNYLGNGGRMALQSELASDDAPSDRLVVSQGTLSGSTSLLVSNIGGQGALTSANGIQVVEANQGATSSNGAFTLGNDLSVGAYQYYLFKGGVTAGSENSWYLRSSVAAPVAIAAAAPPSEVPPEVPPVEPPVEPPVTPPITPPVTPPVTPPTTPPAAPAPAVTAPVAALGTPALPQAAPGQSIPLYRIEVPVYAVVPPAAALLAQVALGTFHERQGEQSLLRERGAVPAGWARTFGSHTRQSWSGDIAPSFDGNIGGYQVGHDLFATLGDNGLRQHAGLFVSHARLKGDVKGFALGLEDRNAGDVRLDGDSLGAYWTLIGAHAWYIDVVAMGTRFDGRSRSERGYTLDLDGNAITLSVEGGYPIALSPRWVIEPQAQVVAQKVDMDSARDPVSHVSFESQEYWRGRVGARLKGNYEVGGTPLEPYVRANLWRTFGGQDTVTFDGNTDLKSDHAASTAQIGAGLVSRLSHEVSVYVSADYNRNLDTQPQEALQGTLGLRVSW
jgi:outer membrane autotransporter protein